MSRLLCKHMANMSLITISTAVSGGAVLVHDVTRDYMRAELGHRLTAANGSLLDALAGDLPSCTPTGPVAHPSRQWWQIQDDYLLDHLVEHLVDAGRRGEAQALAGDLRWVRARLHQHGPTAPVRDLEHVDTPATQAWAADLARAGHLLSPTDPPHCLDAILHSRLHALPQWSPQTDELCPTAPALVDKWPPPDLPQAALRRTLTGHTDKVKSVVVSPDGSWLATSSRDKTVRIWDAISGHPRRTLTGGLTACVVISPDGSWLATTSWDRTVRIWDAAVGRQLHMLTTGRMESVTFSSDNAWLATASQRGVQIWDAATGREHRTLIGHSELVQSVVISPDGTWLTTIGWNQTVRIWHAATGQVRRTLKRHKDQARSVAVSPDGAWLATTGNDYSIRVWDTSTGGPPWP